MSPSRARARRAPAHRGHSRREIATAVFGASAVVLGTVLLIWLMRPGNAVTPGSGGLIHRQPRVSWLVFLAIVALITAIVWIMRSRRFRHNPRVPIAIATVVVILLAIVAGFAWPSGAVRHYISFHQPNSTIPPTASTPTTTPTTTTKPTATTKPATSTSKP
jgi:hypothetical protein